MEIFNSIIIFRVRINAFALFIEGEIFRRVRLIRNLKIETVIRIKTLLSVITGGLLKQQLDNFRKTELALVYNVFANFNLVF